MSLIKYSGTARADLARLYAFLAQYDDDIAQRAIDTIVHGIGTLETHPLSGSPLPDRQNVRKFVIDFGATGYLVFHKRYERHNINFVARIIHQKEWYDEDTIGLEDEKADNAKLPKPSAP